MRDATEIKGVADADLAPSVSALPSFPNLRARDPFRFARSVRTLLENRSQAGWSGELSESQVGAFVLVPRPREFRTRFGSEPIADPGATADPILGRVLLLTRDAAGGEVFRMPCASNELLDWLVTEGLGEAPLVIAYRLTATMTVRLSGANGDLSYDDTIRERPPEVTLLELEHALDHFHKTRLLTPRICIEGVWQSGLAKSYVPGPQPERSIQAGLAFALDFWFRGVVKADVEDSTSIGRIDVSLFAATSGGPLAYWAIVELKVVKSYANADTKAQATVISPSANIEAISKGLRQVSAYKSNRGAGLGLLEVYDLRKEKSHDLFQDQKVKLVIVDLTPTPICAIRPLYGSAEDARLAGETGV